MKVSTFFSSEQRKAQSLICIYVQTDVWIHLEMESFCIYKEILKLLLPQVKRNGWSFEKCMWCTALQAGFQVLLIAKGNNDIF